MNCQQRPASRRAFVVSGVVTVMAQWTDEQREVALGLIRAGTGTNEVSRRTGIPAPTLSRWCKQAGVEVAGTEQVAAAAAATKVKWAERKAELIDRYAEAIEMFLDRATQADTPPGDVRHLIWASAVLTDKNQLLDGAATSRHEQLGLERQRERVLAMTDELAERRERKDGTTGG